MLLLEFLIKILMFNAVVRNFLKQFAFCSSFCMALLAIKWKSHWLQFKLKSQP